MSVMGSSQYSDSPLKCNCKDSTSCFFKLILYVVNHTCPLFWQTQVFADVRAGRKLFGIIRASLCAMCGVIYQVSATSAYPAAQVMLGLVGTQLYFVLQWKRLSGRANFFFSWNFLREGNTWTPSCIFVKLFFKVQQLNYHLLKSWGMMVLTCEPCRALGGLGLRREDWVFWSWSGIWSGAQL